jgi:hypothetical protein
VREKCNKEQERVHGFGLGYGGSVLNVEREKEGEGV